MAEAIMAHADQTIGMCIATATGIYSQAFGVGCGGKGGVPVHGRGLDASILPQLAASRCGTGKVVIAAAIGANSGPVGVHLFTRWGIFESGADNAGLITSAGLALTIR